MLELQLLFGVVRRRHSRLELHRKFDLRLDMAAGVARLGCRSLSRRSTQSCRAGCPIVIGASAAGRPLVLGLDPVLAGPGSPGLSATTGAAAAKERTRSPAVPAGSKRSAWAFSRNGLPSWRCHDRQRLGCERAGEGKPIDARDSAPRDRRRRTPLSLGLIRFDSFRRSIPDGSARCSSVPIAAGVLPQAECRCRRRRAVSFCRLRLLSHAFSYCSPATENPMQTVLCYGDSITWGRNPRMEAESPSSRDGPASSRPASQRLSMKDLAWHRRDRVLGHAASKRWRCWSRSSIACATGWVVVLLGPTTARRCSSRRGEIRSVSPRCSWTSRSRPPAEKRAPSAPGVTATLQGRELAADPWRWAGALKREEACRALASPS